MTSHVDTTREFTLKTDDGKALFVRDWLLADMDKGQARQGLVVMHGLGEHCGRYAHVARFFNALGFIVRTYDQRGHGQSDGASGDVPDSLSLLRDAQVVISDFARQLDGPPILLGHSMGGLFAARYALEQLTPLRALILSSPALAIRMSTLQHGLLKVASSLIPGVGLPNGLQTRYLSHDGEVVRAYQTDPLVHGRLSARLLTSMLQAMDYCDTKASQLTVPLLLMVADDDHLVDPAGSRRFLEKLDIHARTAHFYPGFYHEIFNELDATQVFDDLRTWLELQQYTPVLAIQQAA